MRQNICIILNAKSKKEMYKELFDTLDLYREDKHLDVEYELCIGKDEFEQEYEDFKQKYRDRNPEAIQKRLERFGFNNIEELIEHSLKIYGWETLENYVLKRYNVIRFEGNKCIGLYNPKGYIDYVDSIIACKKYRKFTAKEIDECDISEVILPNKTEITWDSNKDCKSNELKMKQALNRYATKNTYIAMVRVHF